MIMSRTRKIRVAALLLGTLALAGCNKIDPYQREGVWRPSTANDDNLAAMVADPADLTRGRGPGTGSIRTPVTAVQHLWQGPAPSPKSGTGVSTSGAAPQSGSETPR